MPLTIQQVIDTMLAAIPGAPFEDTVDVVKTGDPAQPVTGIVTTFLASQAVLQRAVELGANFIITHEPIFYNHRDDTAWLANDAVYQAKREFIDVHKLVIFRFHDYWHAHQPDGIGTGVLRALGWLDYYDEATLQHGVTIPPMTLQALVAHFKTRLGAQSVRVMGDPEQECRTIGLLVGSPGGHWQITALGQGLDVLVTGEINEWETCEYVRDALHQGRQTALIVLGHAASEEAGMAYLVEWLHERVPAVPIYHVPTGDPFRVE